MNILKRVGKGIAYTVGMIALFLVASISSAYALELGDIVKTQSEVDLEADVETDLDTPVEDIDLDLQSTTSVDVDDEEVSTTSVNLEDALEATIQVDRGDISESEEGAVGGSAPADVRDAESFRIYALGLLEQDEFLKEVESDEEEVSVTYAQRAELFGFIPVYVNTEVSVDARGEVEVDYPWYRFLTKVERSGLAEGLEERVSRIVEGEADTSATSTATTTDVRVEGSLSLRQQAEIVEAVYTELRESLSLDIEAEGEADASIAG